MVQQVIMASFLKANKKASNQLYYATNNIDKVQVYVCIPVIARTTPPREIHACFLFLLK